MGMGPKPAQSLLRVCEMELRDKDTFLLGSDAGKWQVWVFKKEARL